MRPARFVQRSFDDSDRSLARIAVAMQGADLSGQRFQLQDCRGTMHVDAHEHHALPVLVDDPLGEFRRRRRLSRTLQAGQ